MDDLAPAVPTAKLTVNRENDGRLRAWLRPLPESDKLVDLVVYEAFANFDELTVVPGRRSDSSRRARRQTKPAVVPEPLEDEVLVATIEVAPGKTQIRSRFYTYKDSGRADLRTFVYRKKVDAWIPTRRGISVPVQLLPELLEAVHSLTNDKAPG